jgi:hypothetical protein
MPPLFANKRDLQATGRFCLLTNAIRKQQVALVCKQTRSASGRPLLFVNKRDLQAAGRPCLLTNVIRNQHAALVC